MRFGWYRRGLMLAALALAYGGCARDAGPDTGRLVIPFELGNHKDCESLGIERVRAELDEGSIVEEADCDAGQVRFHLLQPGRYEAVLYGLDKSDAEVLDSLESGPVVLDVVGADTTVIAEPPVKLTAAPARLRLRWDFGFATCESAGIDRFGVTAWRGDGSELLLETEVACSQAGEGRGHYRSVPDTERQLSGDELGEVNVQPYDVNGIPVGEAVLFRFDSPGAGGEVRLSLSCDEGGCEGRGEPD